MPLPGFEPGTSPVTSWYATNLSILAWMNSKKSISMDESKTDVMGHKNRPPIKTFPVCRTSYFFGVIINWNWVPFCIQWQAVFCKQDREWKIVFLHNTSFQNLSRFVTQQKWCYPTRKKLKWKNFLGNYALKMMPFNFVTRPLCLVESHTLNAAAMRERSLFYLTNIL